MGEMVNAARKAVESEARGHTGCKLLKTVPGIAWTRAATIVALVGYVCLLGCAKWPETFNLDPLVDLRVPRIHQLMTLAGIALAGVITGQLVRRARTLAESYAVRTGQDGHDSPAQRS